MEVELKITNDGVKRLRNGKILRWPTLEKDHDITIKLRYVRRDEIKRITQEINRRVEKEMHIK